jgi:hypothetical protein
MGRRCAGPNRPCSVIADAVQTSSANVSAEDVVTFLVLDVTQPDEDGTVGFDFLRFVLPGSGMFDDGPMDVEDPEKLATSTQRPVLAISKHVIAHPDRNGPISIQHVKLDTARKTRCKPIVRLKGHVIALTSAKP